MKLLIADDHALFREGLCQLLAALPEFDDIIEAGSEREILARHAQADDIDLMLLDLDMPGVGNARGVARLCTVMCSTAVVVLSGNEAPYIVRACLDAGAMGFIPKSFHGKAMLAAIQVVLSGEQFIPSRLLHEKLAGGMLENIPRRQRQIWQMLSAGQSNKEIARELNLSEGTVKQHVSALYRNLGVHSRAQAVRKASAL